MLLKYYNILNNSNFKSVNPKAIIYWSKTCGLANRLDSLIGYKALSSCLEIPFYLYWKGNWACNIKINKLFKEENLNLIDKKKFSQLKEDRNIEIFDKNYTPKNIWNNYISSFIKEDIYFNHVDKVKEVLSPILPIKEKITSFLDRRNIQNAVGIHIRMTDNINAFKYSPNASDYDYSKVSKIDGFENFIIEKLESDNSQLFFLATDNIKIEKYLLNKYKDNIIIYPKIFYTFNYLYYISFSYRNRRTTTIEDALIDLILLSKCKYIVGTYYSSYGKFSAWFGKRDYYQVIGDKVEKLVINAG